MVTAACGVVSGCGESTFGKIAGVLRDRVDPPDTPLDRAKLEAIPYATVVGRVGSAPWGTMVLGKVDGDDLSWFSADRAVVVTRNGRVVQTGGFPDDLRATNLLSPDPLQSDGLDLMAAPVVRRLVDVPSKALYNSLIVAHWSNEGADPVSIVGKTVDTIRFRERCEMPNAGFAFENIFWRDRTNGLVWKSVQTWVPGTPAMELMLFRPPASAAT